MYFVGVDLAWAGRNPTGVAAVDADGCLVGVGAARDDASVLAAFIDWAPYVVLVGIGWVIMLVTQTSSCVTSISEYDVGQFCVSQPSMIGQLVQWLLSVGGLAYLVWNYGYRQGTIGSSIGKSVLKFKVVSETTGQPIGFGMSVVRQLAHFIDAIICFVGFLFPLWDAKRQTLADKIMTTVCVPI